MTEQEQSPGSAWGGPYLALNDGWAADDRGGLPDGTLAAVSAAMGLDGLDRYAGEYAGWRNAVLVAAGIEESEGFGAWTYDAECTYERLASLGVTPTLSPAAAVAVVLAAWDDESSRQASLLAGARRAARRAVPSDPEGVLAVSCED